MTYSDEFDDLFPQPAAPDAASERRQKISAVLAMHPKQTVIGTAVGPIPHGFWRWITEEYDEQQRREVEAFQQRFLQASTDVEPSAAMIADIALLGDDAAVDDGVVGVDEGAGN